RAVVHMPILDAEGADMALAIKADIVLVLLGLGILRIGADAVKDAVHIVRQVAVHLAVIERVLRAVDAAAGTAAAAEGPAVLAEEHFGLGLCRRPPQRAGQGAGAQRHAAQDLAAVDPAAVCLRILPCLAVFRHLGLLFTRCAGCGRPDYNWCYHCTPGSRGQTTSLR